MTLIIYFTSHFKYKKISPNNLPTLRNHIGKNKKYNLIYFFNVFIN